MPEFADRRLVVALTLLRDQLAAVVDEVLARELGEADRAELARALRAVAEDLSPTPVVRSDEDERPRVEPDPR